MMISAPTITSWIWATISVGQPNRSTPTSFRITGNTTKNAAPANEPNIEPKPPMMINNLRKNAGGVGVKKVAVMRPNNKSQPIQLRAMAIYL